MKRVYLKQNCYEAAVERMHWTFDHFEHVYLSFSGGKDSGVLLNLALQVAKERKRLPLDVLLVDLEAQYTGTVDYAQQMMSREDVRAHWVCLPLALRNAVSQYQPKWKCWDQNAKDIWVRDFPQCEGVITDPAHFDFFEDGMEFEDFVPKFGEWLAGGQRTACLVGIRSDESLNRWRTIASTTKTTLDDKQYSTKVTDSVYNVYPIYDWKSRDVWISNHKFNWPYNKTYDLMQTAGVPMGSMRLCQPFGDDQRKGLFLYKLLEPDTWAKLTYRVEGANFGNRYVGTTATGDYKLTIPPHHTYKSYAKFLLSTMPPHLEAHYRKKIYRFLRWYAGKGDSRAAAARADFKRQGVDLSKGFPDSFDMKLENARKVATWRRIVKVLIKGDYWCKGLGFSQTKREFDEQYKTATRMMSL